MVEDKKKILGFKCNPTRVIQKYNFEEDLIEWTQSYLGDRKQCVR